MSAALLLLWALAASPASSRDAPLILKKPLQIPPVVQPKEHPADPRCEKCHAETGWDDAAFPHDKTGFPLTGRHQKVGCRECHVQGLKIALPRSCGGCHRDAHGSEFGARCEGCHETQGWATTFSADAHRRTNFPLVGAHALIPCQECHDDARGRTFQRPATPCVGCHIQDYVGTMTSLRAINHIAAGFPTTCAQCHEPWRFDHATFPGHDVCFQVTRGVHSAITCLGCHTTVPTPITSGTCSTGTAACTACHSHDCARSDAQHVGVLGYQCKDLKCYACHRFTAGP